MSDWTCTVCGRTTKGVELRNGGFLCPDCAYVYSENPEDATLTEGREDLDEELDHAYRSVERLTGQRSQYLRERDEVRARVTELEAEHARLREQVARQATLLRRWREDLMHEGYSAVELEDDIQQAASGGEETSR